MQENLEHNQRIQGNRTRRTTMPSAGLANTNPVATLGSSLGPSATHWVPGSQSRGIVQPANEGLSESIFEAQTALNANFPLRLIQNNWIVEETVWTEKLKPLKATGPVVLFQKVMEIWGFSEQEAGTLLGFDSASDIRDVFSGRKPLVLRDTNDRLRTVLRIAADLDALFQEPNAVKEWLGEPQKDLSAMTPRALLNAGPMEDLLRVKYYLSYLSGR